MPVTFQQIIMGSGPEVRIEAEPDTGQHSREEAQGIEHGCENGTESGPGSQLGQGVEISRRVSRSDDEDIAPVPRKSKGTKKPPVIAQRINWLKVDAKGEVYSMHMDKYKVIAKLGIQPRDLRLLDPQLHVVSHTAILARESAIVVSLESIKCIITREYVLIVNLDEDTAMQLVRDLSAKFSKEGAKEPSKLSDVRQKLQLGQQVLDLPFELKALETCFDMMVSRIDAVVLSLERETLPVLDSLTKRVSMRDVEAVRRGKNKLVRLKTRVETIHEVFEKFLDDDEDMHRLNLTAEGMARRLSDYDGAWPHVPPVLDGGDAAAAGNEKLKSKQPVVDVSSGGDTSSVDYQYTRPLGRASRAVRTAYKGDHEKHGGKAHSSSSSSSSSSSHSSSSFNSQDEAEVAEVEMLLEAYDMYLENTLNRLQSLDEYIKDTEDLVNTGLDQKRNELITVDLILTANIVALGLITTITGLFGMNILPTWLQNEEDAFNSVAIASSLGSYILFGCFMWWVWNQNILSF